MKTKHLADSIIQLVKQMVEKVGIKYATKQDSAQQQLSL